MRKFTKEISALLAATAMSASVCIASAAETTDQPIRMSGQATVADQEVQPSTIIERTAGVATISNEEYFPPEDGVAMNDEYYEPTEVPTPPTAPEPIGTYMYEEPTEEEFPPTAGVPMIEPTTIEPTTAPSMPPHSIGTWVYEDPTEEDIPPLVGEPTLPDEDIAEPTLRGDADLNGITELTDLVVVTKHAINNTAFPLKNAVAKANADMNGDKIIDGLDVSALTEEQLGNV